MLSSLLTNKTTFIRKSFKIPNNQGSTQKAIAQKESKKEGFNTIVDQTSAELRKNLKDTTSSIRKLQSWNSTLSEQQPTVMILLTVELKLFKFVHLQNK